MLKKASMNKESPKHGTLRKGPRPTPKDKSRVSSFIGTQIPKMTDAQSIEESQKSWKDEQKGSKGYIG